MTARGIELTDQQRDALIDELRSYEPSLDCICCTDGELVRAVERARNDRERGDR